MNKKGMIVPFVGLILVILVSVLIIVGFDFIGDPIKEKILQRFPSINPILIGLALILVTIFFVRYFAPVLKLPAAMLRRFGIG